MIEIEEIEIEDVNNENNKKKYNTNNHWKNNLRPDDYDKKNEELDTKNWINNFKNFYLLLNIDYNDLMLLKNMNNLCLIKNEIPELYKEDFETMIKKYEYVDKYLKINGGHFIRTDNVCLKYSKYGNIPYDNIRMIFESILTCSIGHSPLYNTTNELHIYLIPWIKINKSKEFRVFVYKNKITAISQQYMYQSNEILKMKTKDEKNDIINKWINIICIFFNKFIKNKFVSIENYIYDFCILDNDLPYFIEINPFGREYSSGSALFHWINDNDKIYNTENKLYFRYTI